MTEFRVVGTGVDRRTAREETTIVLAGIQGPAGVGEGNLAVVAHVNEADPHEQYALESAVAADQAAHVAASDPHTQYQLESEKGQANGYASLDAGGKVPDAEIPDGIARDSELSAAISAHEAASDPHTGYQKESEKDQANGYCGLDSNARVAEARLGSGSGTSAKALFGDQAWRTVERTLRFGGGFDSPTAAKNPIVARCPVAGTVTKVYGTVVGGTSATLNAQVGSNDLRSSDIVVNAGSSWTDFGTLQNTSVNAGDLLKIEIVSVSGTPSWVAIQIEVTPS